MDLADLRHQRAYNPAGTKQVFYVAFPEDFDTIGALPDAPATLAERNVIVTDHTFAAASGKGFVKVELEVNKNALDAVKQAAVKGGAKKISFTGFHTGVSDEALAFMELVEQGSIIALVPFADGKVFQLGEENNGAWMRSDFATGQQDGGERGFPVLVEYYGRLARYDGTITFASDNV